jgi:hypothetical protein
VEIESAICRAPEQPHTHTHTHTKGKKNRRGGM